MIIRRVTSLLLGLHNEKVSRGYGKASPFLPKQNQLCLDYRRVNVMRVSHSYGIFLILLYEMWWIRREEVRDHRYCRTSNATVTMIYITEFNKD